MAQPISLKPLPRDPKEELRARLEHAPEEHAAALLDGYELLQTLYEHGVFTMARGLVGASDKLVEVASARVNSEESIRAMRNAVLLAKMLGSIDPEVLAGACEAVSETFGDAKMMTAEPLSLWGVIASRDLRRGLGLMERLLGNLARQLKIRSRKDSGD
jgi:hypothetical protein